MAVRFLSEHTPTSHVETVARDRGMKDGDGSSFWDWLEPEECTIAKEYKRFRYAADHAKKHVEVDVFGEARIREQHAVYHNGRVIDWRTQAMWHVYPETTDIHENQPDECRTFN